MTMTTEAIPVDAKCQMCGKTFAAHLTDEQADALGYNPRNGCGWRRRFFRLKPGMSSAMQRLIEAATEVQEASEAEAPKVFWMGADLHQRLTKALADVKAEQAQYGASRKPGE